MSLAEKLKAEGRAEGQAEGKAEGEAKGFLRGQWLARLQLLQELAFQPVTPESILRELEPAELEKRYLELKKAYGAQNKGRA